jgi:hypothetical protein
MAAAAGLLEAKALLGSQPLADDSRQSRLPRRTSQREGCAWFGLLPGRAKGSLPWPLHCNQEEMRDFGAGLACWSFHEGVPLQKVEIRR